MFNRHRNTTNILGHLKTVTQTVTTLSERCVKLNVEQISNSEHYLKGRRLLNWGSFATKCSHYPGDTED